MPHYHVYVPAVYTGTMVLVTWMLAVLFCLWYTWDAIHFKVENPWWRTPMGINMFTLAATIALVLVPSVLFKLFGINVITAFWQWYGTVVFTMTAPVLLHRLGYGIFLRVRELRSSGPAKPPERSEQTSPGQ